MMAALPRTETAMHRALVDLADAGTLTASAATVATKAGLKRDTAMRWGRESLPTDLTRQWRATYHRGSFSVEEREGYQPPAPPVAPDWFELPRDLTKRERSRSSFDIGRRMMLTSQFIQSCLDGQIALAPWQRESVWSERQQIALLDSMIRGLSIGALTMWHRPRTEALDGARALPGCAEPNHDGWSTNLIVDGQQRATTLVLAAQGKLDHWRWNGHEWTTGQGFITPRLAVLDIMMFGVDQWRNWGGLIFDGMPRGQADIAYRQKETIERTDLDLMVLGGTADEMIETYRRLATHGSPHSPADLAVMERWLAAHRASKRETGEWSA
jgi:hypothetical protein